MPRRDSKKSKNDSKKDDKQVEGSKNENGAIIRLQARSAYERTKKDCEDVRTVVEILERIQNTASLIGATCSRYETAKIRKELKYQVDRWEKEPSKLAENSKINNGQTAHMCSATAECFGPKTIRRGGEIPDANICPETNIQSSVAKSVENHVTLSPSVTLKYHATDLSEVESTFRDIVTLSKAVQCGAIQENSEESHLLAIDQEDVTRNMTIDTKLEMGCPNTHSPTMKYVETAQLVHESHDLHHLSPQCVADDDSHLADICEMAMAGKIQGDGCVADTQQGYHMNASRKAYQHKHEAIVSPHLSWLREKTRAAATAIFFPNGLHNCYSDIARKPFNIWSANIFTQWAATMITGRSSAGNVMQRREENTTPHSADDATPLKMPISHEDATVTPLNKSKYQPAPADNQSPSTKKISLTRTASESNSSGADEEEGSQHSRLSDTGSTVSYQTEHTSDYTCSISPHVKNKSRRNTDSFFEVDKRRRSLRFKSANRVIPSSSVPPISIRSSCEDRAIDTVLREHCGPPLESNVELGNSKRHRDSLGRMTGARRARLSRSLNFCQTTGATLKEQSLTALRKSHPSLMTRLPQVPWLISADRIRFALANGRMIMLGRGTNSIVFLGTLLPEETFVAVKLLFKNRCQAASVFLDGGMLARLNDSGVTPKFYGIGFVEEDPKFLKYSLITEFIGSMTTLKTTDFSKLLERRASCLSTSRFFGNHPLSNAEWLQLMTRLLQAIILIHRTGIVVNDIKADNVMCRRVGSDWQPVLVDFGLSAYGSYTIELTLGLSRDTVSADRKSGASPINAFLHRFRHTAPELVTKNVCCRKSDVYAIGNLMREVSHTIDSPVLQQLSVGCLRHNVDDRYSTEYLLRRLHQATVGTWVTCLPRKTSARKYH